MSDKSVGLFVALVLVLALWAAGAPWWVAIAIILAPVALGIIGGIVMLVVLLVMTPIRDREAELARHARRKPGRYVGAPGWSTRTPR